MIPHDKRIHFTVCFVMAVILFPLIGWWGAVFSILAGVAKEMFDYDDYGVFSWWDILADLAGTAAAILIMILIKIL